MTTQSGYIRGPFRAALCELFAQELKHSAEAVLIQDLLNLLADLMQYETNPQVQKVIVARLNAIANDCTVTAEDVFLATTQAAKED